MKNKNITEKQKELIKKFESRSMNINTLVYDMLTESTGTDMCDSGGDDNRHWQKNQKRSMEDFINDEIETIDKDDEWYYRTISLFHYLTDGLEIDSICQEFNNINKDPEKWDSHLWGVCYKAYKHLRYYYSPKIQGEIYNSYNWDSDLSQDIQYQFLYIDNACYVLIQIHNGADVRGGYTSAKLFKCKYDQTINIDIITKMDQYELEELYRDDIPS
tara:strand:- start:6678 stop:7325 length:648 start_codon:yes stop_codon:yes gene_type:complete